MTVAALTTGVVGLAAMRLHLRMDPNDTSEDDQIVACELAAAAAVERHTQRLLVSRAVTLRLPGLPEGRCPVELPGGIVTAVSSVEADGAAISGAVAYGHSPAVLVPASDWPVVTGVGYPVVIQYTAGFATVPADLVAAVKLWSGHLFANREAVGAPMSEVPLALQALVAPNRIHPA